MENTKEKIDKLKDYRKKLSKLTEEEIKNRDLYLKKLADGELQGPPTGYSSIDKGWLQYYSDEAIMSDVPKMTAYEYMKQNNLNNMNGIALNFFGLKTPYKKLFEKIEQTTKSLIELGVKEGDTVVINSVTLPQTIYLLYALNRIGAIANLTDLRTDSNGMKHYLNEGKSKILFTLDAAYPNVKDIINETDIEKIVFVNPMDEVPKLAQKITVAQENKDLSQEEINKKNEFNKSLDEAVTNNENIIRWNQFYKDGKKSTILRDKNYEVDYPMAIVHTSGTTSMPKSVVLTNDNFNAMALQYKVANVEYNSSQSFLNIIPMFVAYGAVNALHMPLCLGMTNIVYPKVVGDDFPDILLKFKPDHVLAIPMHWDFVKSKTEDLKELLENSKRELKNMHDKTSIRNKKNEISKLEKKLGEINYSFLKTAGCGGDNLNPEKEKELNEFLKEYGSESKIIKGYGMTEVSSCATTNLNTNNKIGSIGVPLVKNNVSMFDPDTGREVLMGEKGEICIQSPTLMKEYLNNEEDTKKAIKEHEDGSKWIHSGDLGHYENDGRITFDDRLKRMIINRGFKVSAVAIEKIIMTHPAVDTCAVVGVNHVENGQIPVANIVLKKEYLNDSDKKLDEIKLLCEQALPEYYVPVFYSISDKLPFTENNKLDFKKIENMMNEKYNDVKKR